MSKTKIEWCDYTINPVKGLCPVACTYCYARAMYHRFKWNPAIRFEPETLLDLATVPEDSKVFIGSTMELFHEYTEQWMPYILGCVKRAPWQTSILLTKQPQNLIKFSPFPDNCYVGVSWIGDDKSVPLKYLERVEAKVKFISFEPLLVFSAWWTSDLLKQAFEKAGISWVIIGSQTKPNIYPPIEAVRKIVEACDKIKLPIFMKDNLRPMWYDYLRQEMPVEDNYADHRRD